MVSLKPTWTISPFKHFKHSAFRQSKGSMLSGKNSDSAKKSQGSRGVTSSQVQALFSYILFLPAFVSHKKLCKIDLKSKSASHIQFDNSANLTEWLFFPLSKLILMTFLTLSVWIRLRVSGIKLVNHQPSLRVVIISLSNLHFQKLNQLLWLKQI